MRQFVTIKATTTQAISTMAEPAVNHKHVFPAAPVVIAQQRSPWRSPVPYLFGGLAAMLGLITFALLLLACSYWKLSSRSPGGGDIETGGGEKQIGPGENMTNKVYEEKILVIMAGEEKPTFLATPVLAKTRRSSVCVSGRTVNTDGEEGHKGESVLSPTRTEESSHEEDQ